MSGGVCPSCGSMARHRLIPYSISHFRLDFSGGALLHVGPSLDEAAYIFRHHLPRPYYRLDIVPKPLVNLLGDLRKIPLGSNTVQHILIWHVLEHVSDDRSAIEEMHRVLCPGGKMLASVPIFPPGRIATYEAPSVPRERFKDVFGHDDHVRACGQDYGRRFEAVGFNISKLAVDELPDGEVALFGLSKGHIVWCCTK